MKHPEATNSGSSLIACVHRLARLQTTREIRPRPTLVDKRELAIDRLILAARRVLTLGVVLAIAGASAGCVEIVSDVGNLLIGQYAAC